MTGFRRIATIIGLTLGVIAAASLPASASFSDSAAITTTVGTLTVAAPAWVDVNDTCTTTTTVVKRTVYTAPATGAQWQTSYSSMSTSVTSPTNVNSSTTSTVAGPGLNETTTTTTTKNTVLYVTASWGASGSRGVSGYLVNASLSDGSVHPMAQTTAGRLSTSGAVDADALVYGPRLSVTTLTSYGWTAESARTRVLAC